MVVAHGAVFGGAERRLPSMVEGLASAGASVTVVALDEGEVFDICEHLAPVVPVPAGRLRDTRSFSSTVRALAELSRATKTDLVYAHAPKTHLYTGVAALALRVPAVWSQLNVPSPPSLLDRAATALPARLVLANSRATANAQSKIRPTRSVSVVYPGTDTSRFRPTPVAAARAELGLATGTRVVASIGRLQRWKNHSVFLRAAQLVAVSTDDVHFVVVGSEDPRDPGHGSALQAEARSLGIERLVSFVGHRSDVETWMCASDIVVNASDGEPFGQVVTEAMSCGTAVVAVDSAGPSEIIEHGVDGVLVSQPDPHLFANSIVDLLKDASLRQRIGAHARRTVEERFGLDAMKRSFADALGGVLSERKISVG